MCVDDGLGQLGLFPLGVVQNLHRESAIHIVEVRYRREQSVKNFVFSVNGELHHDRRPGATGRPGEFDGLPSDTLHLGICMNDQYPQLSYGEERQHGGKGYHQHAISLTRIPYKCSPAY
ncbi:hypothetical protein [Streptomyces sp. NBC_00162]|uniref:hypothetical protein n=1 Tax=Streptomyces sp. NBC_00162 TaxID=2903629 RepID=UPI00214CBB23|nr:hypothetical protein [Streptomyces sp. NBC_00162]UUU44251.1 hypothetical protein JIW86_39135 [Streptomyces sp. NBC_00162]